MIDLLNFLGERTAGLLSSTFAAFISLFIWWLPNADFDNSTFVNAASTIMVMGKQLSFVVPWQTLWFNIIFIGTLEAAILSIKLIMVVIRLIRGGG